MIHPSTPGAGDREGGDGPSASLRGAARRGWKLIIAGSRDATEQEVREALAQIRIAYVSEVVSGACPTGADFWGEMWARENGIPVKRFPADWRRHGRAAGPIRNRDMADYGEALAAIWNGISTGTKGMIREMEQRKKPVLVIRTARSAPEAPSPKGPQP
jgi:hypothetical protein